MKRILLIASLIFLLLGGTAEAKSGQNIPPEGWGAHQIHLAELWWGQYPTNCTSLNIEFEATAFANGPGTAGEATEPSSPEPCIMRVRAVAFIPMLCQIVLHEYGHLLGYGHSPDPSSIMYGIPRSEEPGAPAWFPEHIGICYRGNGLKLAKTEPIT
jgi:hypothetical protein